MSKPVKINSVEDVTDWQIPDTNALSGIVYPGGIEIAELPFLHEAATLLLQRAKGMTTRDFMIQYEQTGTFLRGHRLETVQGVFFMLRRMPKDLPSLEKLGLIDPIRKILIHPYLNKGGLVLVCGEAGNGKSTTCASLIKARLENYGGFCLTIEDPPEMPLHGRHGAGICVQSPVLEGEFGDALVGAMRCYPSGQNSMLYIGEVRSPETAGEALRIAMNGHLVVSTLHAADIMTGVRRFLSMASAYSRMSESEAKSVFASVMRLILHQKIETALLRDKNDLSAPPLKRKLLKASILFSAGASSTTANRIRSGNIDQLVNELQQQATLLERNEMHRLMESWNSPQSSTSGSSGVSSFSG